MEKRALRKLALVCASELTLKAFLLEHIRAMALHYEVTVIADGSDPNLLRKLGIPVELIPVPIAREIAPLRDLRALARLTAIFRAKGFDLVHSVTPKAGLLAMAAAFIARVPLRVHIFTGQVWVTRAGFMRALLKAADQAIAAMATHVLADSRSQLEFMLQQGITDAGKARVLAQGSIAGVDLERFKPDAAARARVRAGLGIDADALVFLYLGRLRRDKGVLDLCRAFARVARPKLLLLAVGPDEEGLGPQMRLDCPSQLRLVDYTAEPEAYFAAADVFCLPSYREGFGTVIIEAAAAGLPAIGSRIYGITDAIVEGETGLLFPAGDVDALAAAMRRFIEEAGLRARMGEKARRRVERDFSAPALTQALLDFYRSLPSPC
jgi:glycosyltransferase involved in cell wall biosynthesis